MKTILYAGGIYGKALTSLLHESCMNPYSTFTVTLSPLLNVVYCQKEAKSKEHSYCVCILSYHMGAANKKLENTASKFRLFKSQWIFTICQ